MSELKTVDLLLEGSGQVGYRGADVSALVWRGVPDERAEVLLLRVGQFQRERCLAGPRHAVDHDGATTAMGCQGLADARHGADPANELRRLLAESGQLADF